ncbi:hypothetical protein BD408DRAFT_426002 [Parasitella parasitica]|nr:hypothetical protein BD408DRAFT_426002 [Parasitella parasitica]
MAVVFVVWRRKKDIRVWCSYIIVIITMLVSYYHGDFYHNGYWYLHKLLGFRKVYYKN